MRSCPFPRTLPAGPTTIDPTREAAGDKSELFKLAIGDPCATDDALLQLFDLGRSDARRWQQTQGADLVATK